MDSQQPLASKQRTLGTGSAAGHMENPTVELTCESKSDGNSSLTGAHPLTKRKWDAYVGRENERSAPRDSTSQISIITTASNVQVINISSSDEESQANSALQSQKLKRKKEKKKMKKRGSAKTPSEALSQWSPILGPSSPETIVPGLTSEGFESEPKQDSIIEPSLCEEQQRLVDTIMTGRNVFYTGSAGCGKSTVLKNFVKRLKAQMIWKGGDQKEPKRVDIIAPTGRAALDINGSTSWTYAGWNPDSMKKPLEKLKEVAENGKWIRKRLRATDVLVIDEISMMENHHLERLNEIMQSARGNTRAFGGVQLVVTGGMVLSHVSRRKSCSHEPNQTSVNSHPSSPSYTATNAANSYSKAKQTPSSPAPTTTAHGTTPRNGPSVPQHGQQPTSFTSTSPPSTAKATKSSSTFYKNAASASPSPHKKKTSSSNTPRKPPTPSNSSPPAKKSAP